MEDRHCTPLVKFQRNLKTQRQKVYRGTKDPRVKNDKGMKSQTALQLHSINICKEKSQSTILHLHSPYNKILILNVMCLSIYYFDSTIPYLSLFLHHGCLFPLFGTSFVNETTLPKNETNCTIIYFFDFSRTFSENDDYYNHRYPLFPVMRTRFTSK